MRKWILRIVLGLLLFLLISVAGLIYFIRKTYSPEKVKAELTATLSRKSGLAVSIGALEFTWSGDIKLRQICVRNPQLVSDRCVIAANITSLDLRILPLLKKRIEIRAAHLEDMVLNLFTEQSKDKTGKMRILRSWDIPVNVAADTPASGGAEVKLDALKVSNGVVLQEDPSLPLPLGKTKFRLGFSEGSEKKLGFEAEYPDGGFSHADLKIRSENILQSFRSLIKEARAADADAFSGELECRRCSGAALDKRIVSVTGRFNLEASHNRIKIQAARAEMQVAGPVNGVLGYSGNFLLVLPAFAVEEASGNLSGAGLTVVYNNLQYLPGTGLKGDFDATVDFSGVRSLIQLPPNLKGTAFVRGKLEKNAASGIVRVKNFEYVPAAGMVLQSADFSANFSNSTLSLKGQAFRFNEHVLAVTGTVAGNDIRLAVSAPVLQYQKWRAENFSGNIRRTGQQLTLSDASMIFARGRLTAQYTRTLGSGAQALRLSASGVKAQELSTVFGLKTTVFGDISGDANMVFTGDSIEEVRKNLSGTANLRVSRGKIKDSFFTKGVLGGPLHKLEEKFSDIEFAAATADLAFRGGRIDARKVFFDAEEWNISLRADADADGNGKAALDFRFKSSFVENLANPLHLGIEGRKEGEFYELPFACRGNIFTGACYKKNW